MPSLYFPGGGFGFWYLLGIYIKLRDTVSNFHDYQIVGCSAGSLICLVSLLKEEYLNLYFLVVLFQESLQEQRQLLNIHTLVSKLFELAKDYIDYEKLSLNLQNLRIHVTEIDFFWGCLPKLNKKIVSPLDLDHLKDLILASCQIPVLGRSQNHCFFIEINHKFYLDGMFSENQFDEDEYHQKFDTSEYLSLRLPSEDYIHDMYSNGYNLVDISRGL